MSDDRVRTSLYRMYSRQGDLLYIGITKSINLRLNQHDAGKNWYHLVDQIKLEHYGTRHQARAAEVAAIRSESPAFNLADRAPGDEPRLAEYGVEDTVDYLPLRTHLTDRAFRWGAVKAALTPAPGTPYSKAEFATRLAGLRR